LPHLSENKITFGGLAIHVWYILEQYYCIHDSVMHLSLENPTLGKHGHGWRFVGDLTLCLARGGGGISSFLISPLPCLMGRGISTF